MSTTPRLATSERPTIKLKVKPYPKKPKRYCVLVTRTYTFSDGWVSSRELPAFFLDASVQGIVSAEHAERIVREIVFDDEHTTHHIEIQEAP